MVEFMYGKASDGMYVLFIYTRRFLSDPTLKGLPRYIEIPRLVLKICITRSYRRHRFSDDSDKSTRIYARRFRVPCVGTVLL